MVYVVTYWVVNVVVHWVVNVVTHWVVNVITHWVVYVVTFWVVNVVTWWVVNVVTHWVVYIVTHWVVNVVINPHNYVRMNHVLTIQIVVSESSLGRLVVDWTFMFPISKSSHNSSKRIFVHRYERCRVNSLKRDAPAFNTRLAILLSLLIYTYCPAADVTNATMWYSL